MSEQTLKLIADNDVTWVDLRFTDTKGKEQHVTIPASEVDADFFEEGKMFDGSSISGWKGINESDMILQPEDSTSVIDPFTDDNGSIFESEIETLYHHGITAGCTQTRFCPAENVTREQMAAFLVRALTLP